MVGWCVFVPPTKGHHAAADGKSRLDELPYDAKPPLSIRPLDRHLTLILNGVSIYARNRATVEAWLQVAGLCNTHKLAISTGHETKKVAIVLRTVNEVAVVSRIKAPLGSELVRICALRQQSPEPCGQDDLRGNAASQADPK